MNLSFAEIFEVRYPDACERLLMDVVRGNPTLFKRDGRTWHEESP